MNKEMKQKINISIIGLGYVGLPLAIEFSKKYSVVGYDIDKSKILKLREGEGFTDQVTSKDLKKAINIKFTSEKEDLKDCNCFIVTVPTPIDKNKIPDLKCMIDATNLISENLKKNDTVIYESTVYPGATEEVFIPILEEKSGLIVNEDFFVGYSPERINPGDKNHQLTDIIKITSGFNEKTSFFVDDLYSSIITAGTFRTSSIKVAEAAKVIENTQRDINIALINELFIIFDKLKLNTNEVLAAAETKWNFIPFKPGLVGGHCIGVDPYYLTFKSESEGYKPKVILSGREINDEMANYLVEKFIKMLQEEYDNVENCKILIAGFTFKENCSDSRNTKILDFHNILKKSIHHIEIFDPWVEEKTIQCNKNINFIEMPKHNFYDAVFIGLAHDQFKKLGKKGFKSFLKNKKIIFDFKSLFD